eukprot:3674546-Pyramimonas_sp.AAC.2
MAAEQPETSWQDNALAGLLYVLYFSIIYGSYFLGVSKSRKGLYKFFTRSGDADLDESTCFSAKEREDLLSRSSGGPHSSQLEPFLKSTKYKWLRYDASKDRLFCDDCLLYDDVSEHGDGSPNLFYSGNYYYYYTVVDSEAVLDEFSRFKSWMHANQMLWKREVTNEDGELTGRMEEISFSQFFRNSNTSCSGPFSLN